MGDLSDRANPEKQAQYEMIKNIFGNERNFITAVLNQCHDKGKLEMSNSDIALQIPTRNLEDIMEHLFYDTKQNPFVRRNYPILHEAVKNDMVHLYELEDGKIRVVEHKPSKDFGHLVHIFINGPRNNDASITYHKDNNGYESITYTDCEGTIRGIITQSPENSYSIPSNSIQNLRYHEPSEHNSISYPNATVDSDLLAGKTTMLDILETIVSDYEMESFKGEGRIAIEDFKRILSLVPELEITPQTDATIALGIATNENNNLKAENAQLKAQGAAEIAKRENEITSLQSQVTQQADEIAQLKAQLAAEKQANKSSQDTITSLHSVIDSIKGIVAKVPFVGKKLSAKIDDLLHSKLPAPSVQPNTNTSGHSKFVENLVEQAQQPNGQEIPLSQQTPQPNQILDGQEPFDD